MCGSWGADNDFFKMDDLLPKEMVTAVRAPTKDGREKEEESGENGETRGRAAAEFVVCSMPSNRMHWQCELFVFRRRVALFVQKAGRCDISVCRQPVPWSSLRNICVARVLPKKL